MDQFSGVIPESEYRESNPVRHLCQQVIEGRKRKFSRKEMEQIVNQRYFSFEPLTSPTPKEESFLRACMVQTLLNRFNGYGRSFLESACYQSTWRDDMGYAHIYTEKALKAAGMLSSPNFKLMTVNAKLKFLDDPLNLECRWHSDSGGSSYFAQMGYRKFREYGKSSTIKKRIAALQAVKGKRLHILDLGGGIGLALKDLKALYPELITYNATRDEEFCHYPADFHIVGFIERLPAALRRKIDLIVSNFTTRYLAYADLVIEGCVAMLAKGGILDIFFSSERSDNRSEEDIQLRMKKAFDFLMQLKRSGMAKVRIGHRFWANDGGCYKSAPRSLYPAASVFVQKI